MYQSFYRKYRPQYLSDIVGQDVIVKILKNEINNNQITHAYLFTGPRGTGKTSIAKILAKTVNCSNLINVEPCNKCVNCTQIITNQSVDIIEIDAASNNGVDEIRELRSKVSLVPSIGKYKIYIIDEVHMLTTGAFNALLKTLEEPPAHVIFILATTESHKIPTTIVSRCQKFDFKRISEEHIVKRLEFICKEEQINIEKSALNEIARLSAGGLRDAIGILEQVFSYSSNKITISDVHDVNGTLPQQELKQIIKYILDEDIENIFNKINEYDNRGKNLFKLLEEIILFLKNIIIYQKTSNFINENISQEIYGEVASKISTKELIDMITKINDLYFNLKQYNNPKLVIEIIMLSLLDIKKEKRIEHLQQDFDEKNIEMETGLKIKNESNPKTNTNNDIEMINLIKDIRVNNTFINPKREILDEIKQKIKNVRKYLLDSQYMHIASVVIDGEVRAANKNNLVLVYKNKYLSNNLNMQIKEAEKLIFDILQKEYKVVAVAEEEWSLYKEQYKKNRNNYSYIPENEEIIKFINNQKKDNQSSNEIEAMFGDIIEYVK